MIQTTETIWHWVIIKVYSKYGGELLEFVKWDMLSTPVRNKWDWYFKYRAALFQIAYPKAYVELLWGNKPKYSEEEIRNIDLKNSIAGKKRMITKISNAINETKAEWNELFPIEEYPLYKKAMAKLERYKLELQELTK